jgi:aspartokinase/homoserine dehydrogenase 1
MKVLKFGGTSVGSPDRIRGVKRIIESQKFPCIVVVSAFSGITDQLKLISELAEKRDEEYKIHIKEALERHLNASRYLVKKNLRDTVEQTIKEMFEELKETLNGIYLVRELSLRSLDLILSFGERLSSCIISNCINGCTYVDSRKLIKTDDNFGNANVNFRTSDDLIRKELSGIDNVVILPGFIGSTDQNETTTLGRGGSDYTSAIIAAALEAEVLEIWTDVDGFMTADPKKVEKSYAIENLTYSEAIELSHFGAKVIYTPTLRPVYKKNIPLVIKNTFNPDAKGTLISSTPSENNRSPIKGISSIDHIDLITLQGTAMIGVTGTSMRLFGALAKYNINIILITQASSEYSITFAVNPADSKKAEKAIYDEFEREIELSKELKVLTEKDLSIIAIVGEGMKNTPGISATLFRSLGRNGINVIATAQGSSELNISVVIKNSSLKNALNVIHEGFFLSRYKELHLFVVGTGLVGTSLLRQMQKQYELLLKEFSLKINLVGVANSRKMLIDKNKLHLASYINNLDNLGVKTDLKEFLYLMRKMNLRNSIFIDCTANDQVAQLYNDVLSSYISVVTANKIACSSEYSTYKRLKSTAIERGVRFMYETNVGAGLPIINTINDLMLSGDKILKIEAVLSGTLNFIFNEINKDVPLSKAIRRAKEKGYSEPDPRIDLSGMDVVRKILILSREAGYKIEKEDIEVNKFLPENCFEGTMEDFWVNVGRYDDEFEIKRKKLEIKGEKWRFFATMDQGKVKVELLTVTADHPSYHLAGSNNIILLTTERYKELPMVIKGYGAGAEVTAAGVFADIMRVANV